MAQKLNCNPDTHSQKLLSTLIAFIGDVCLGGGMEKEYNCTLHMTQVQTQGVFSTSYVFARMARE